MYRLDITVIRAPSLSPPNNNPIVQVTTDGLSPPNGTYRR
jgi:hypothetical protein